MSLDTEALGGEQTRASSQGSARLHWLYGYTFAHQTTKQAYMYCT